MGWAGSWDPHVTSSLPSAPQAPARRLPGARREQLQCNGSGCPTDGRGEAGGGQGLPRAEPPSPHPLLQVCLFFQNQLFRGNRVTKVDARRFAAFCSPNLPPLAIVGPDVTSEQAQLVRAPALGRAGCCGESLLGAGAAPLNRESTAPPSALDCMPRSWGLLGAGGLHGPLRWEAPGGNPCSEPGDQPLMCPLATWP